MAKRKGSRQRGRGVSASELAQMGVCERLVLFEHQRGERHTARQLHDLARGRDAHDRFHRQGQAEEARRGRCFVATLVFGESSETQALRDFRDQVMRPSVTGRRLIAAYYRMAPVACRLLMQRPGAIHVVRCMLRPVVWLAARHLEVGRARHDR